MIDPLPDEKPPSRPIARAGRDVLEGVLLRLSALPAKVDRGAIQAALAVALSALGRLERSELDDLEHLDLLRAAASALGSARALTSAAEAIGGGAQDLSKSVLDVENAISGALDPTITRVVSRQDRVLRRGREPEPEKPKTLPFRVCGGAPHLFTLARRPLPPLLVAERPARRLDAEARDALARDDRDADDPGSNTDSVFFGGAGERGAETFGSEEALLQAQARADDSEAAGLGRLLRDVMEEIGSLGMLRSPKGPPVAWGVGLVGFEERLLADVDAFMALAEPVSGEPPFIDAIDHLVAWAGDAMVPDPVRAFARTFLLGCVAGEDAARAAVLSLRRSHPITHDAERDALALAPHPHIGRELSRMFAEETPELLRLAVDVLRRRREVSFEAVAPLLSHPHPTVREAAARALAVTSAPEPALRLLMEHAASEEDDAALLAAAEALLVLGSARGLAVVRDKLEEEAQLSGSLSRPVRSAALRLLAVSGGRADGTLLCRLLRRDPAAALALGWHGDPSVVPLLLGQLTEVWGQPKLHGFARALAAALHRITGLGRPPGDPGRTPVYVVEPPLEPDFWRAAWETATERFARPVRYRFGRAFTPLGVIAEAETNEVSTAVQRELLAELSILSRGAARADPDGWIAHRRAALAELTARFTASRYPEGQWPAGVLFET